MDAKQFITFLVSVGEQFLFNSRRLLKEMLENTEDKEQKSWNNKAMQIL